MDRFWTRFVAKGDVADTAPGDSSATKKLPIAQLAVAVELAAGEEKSVPFILSWRFPRLGEGQPQTIQSNDTVAAVW